MKAKIHVIGFKCWQQRRVFFVVLLLLTCIVYFGLANLNPLSHGPHASHNILTLITTANNNKNSEIENSRKLHNSNMINSNSNSNSKTNNNNINNDNNDATIIYRGNKILDFKHGLEITITLYNESKIVIFDLSGPVETWFAIGFGQRKMLNSYAIVVDGFGDITERKLGHTRQGRSLQSSITKIHETEYSHIGLRDIRLMRSMISNNDKDYFSFDIIPSISHNHHNTHNNNNNNLSNDRRYSSYKYRTKNKNQSTKNKTDIKFDKNQRLKTMPIVNIPIIYAFGETPTLSYHGTNHRNISTISLYAQFDD